MDLKPATSSKSTKAFSTACKEIVHSVITFCEEEAIEGEVLIPLAHTTKRASRIAGVSLSTVKRIRREANGEDNPKFKPPKKRQKKKTLENIGLADFDADVIRRAIHEFFVTWRKAPTVPKLRPVLEEKINFRYKKDTLRKILHEIGFCFKMSRKKKIMEQSDVVLSRTQFLRAIQRFREEKRPIVYVGATWMDRDLTFGNCSQIKECGIPDTEKSSRRVIFLFVGGEMGFIPNTTLLYRTDAVTGDYCGQMNSRIFEKWAEEKLIPNLPKDAIVIIDNGSYHSTQLNKVPNFNDSKQVIMSWLSANNISHSPDMRKVELLDLVKKNSYKDKVFKFDTMLKDHGFLALRLPLYHCDINAIEYVWAETKNVIEHCNKTFKSANADVDMLNLFKASEQAISSVTAENWIKYCSCVVSLENIYWERDGIIEEIFESLPMNTVESSEGDSDTDTDNDD